MTVSRAVTIFLFCSMVYSCHEDAQQAKQRLPAAATVREVCPIDLQGLGITTYCKDPHPK